MAEHSVINIEVHDTGIQSVYVPLDIPTIGTAYFYVKRNSYTTKLR